MIENIILLAGISVACACLCIFYNDNKLHAYVYVTISCILGILLGRLYYVFFNITSDYDGFFNFNGDISLYGVLAGVILAALIVKLIMKTSAMNLLNQSVIPLFIIIIAVRVTHYFMGSNYGMKISSPSLQHFPWSVYSEASHSWMLAVFVMEAMYCLISILIVAYYIKCNGRYPFVSGLTLYSIGRVVFESLRKDSIYIGFVKISQVVSILLVIALMIFLYIKKVKNGEGRKWHIVLLIISLASITIAFLAQFFMGTEVEVLYSTVIAICMFAILLVQLYLMFSEKQKNMFSEKQKSVDTNEIS